MKKFIILLFSVGLGTVVLAQSGRRYDNSYQSSPYSYNDQYRNDDRYSNRGYHNQYESRSQRLARQRYELMMMRRHQARYRHTRVYDRYPAYGYSRKPSVQIRIGIGSRSRY